MRTRITDHLREWIKGGERTGVGAGKASPLGIGLRLLGVARMMVLALLASSGMVAAQNSPPIVESANTSSLWIKFDDGVTLLVPRSNFEFFDSYGSGADDNVLDLAELRNHVNRAGAGIYEFTDSTGAGFEITSPSNTFVTRDDGTVYMLILSSAYLEVWDDLDGTPDDNKIDISLIAANVDSSNRIYEFYDSTGASFDIGSYGQSGKALISRPDGTLYEMSLQFGGSLTVIDGLDGNTPDARVDVEDVANNVNTLNTNIAQWVDTSGQTFKFECHMTRTNYVVITRSGGEVLVIHRTQISYDTLGSTPADGVIDVANISENWNIASSLRSIYKFIDSTGGEFTVSPLPGDTSDLIILTRDDGTTYLFETGGLSNMDDDDGTDDNIVDVQNIAARVDQNGSTVYEIRDTLGSFKVSPGADDGFNNDIHFERANGEVYNIRYSNFDPFADRVDGSDDNVVNLDVIAANIADYREPYGYTYVSAAAEDCPEVGGGVPPIDTDNDGIPDIDDLDDDNDGIPDTVEEATAINGGDTDGDGIPDSLDLDSDNDGILDITEAGHAAADADNDGRLDGPVGTDGIPDVVQGAGNEDAGTINYTPVDTDGDGHPDFQDLDSDNDGINDVIESDGTDANNDGQADDPIDGDGVPGSVPAGGATPPDTDGDTVPDYQDLDSDNDGINDVVEAGLPDPDNNGIVGTGATPTDTDDDGIVDDVDGTPNAFGDSGSPAPTNTDNDPIPDYRDLDSDNDSIGDVIEGGNGPVDTDGNGTIDPTEGGGDTDGDGIPNNVDEDPTNFGDAGNPALPNEDGTDGPDFQDTDSNDDGTNDIEDAGNSPLDGNDDGVIDDPTDPDGDGIPNVGGNDSQPADFGGTDAPDTTDTDNDGIPDSVDLDDDNDGIPDTVEEATAINGGDTDGDGIPDSLDLDSDNDGILDITEAGHGAADADNDGRLDGPVGTDGIPDAVQDTGDEDAGTINYTPVDTDGDGSPDFQDLDSDNDGINDVIESDGTDANNDGQADDPIDGNGVPSSVPVGGATPPDTDGDNVPDYQDLDSDNDGINDVVEAGLPDPDNNGIVGTGATPTDTDDDGIVDDVDGTPNAFGDSGSPAPTNTDNDPIPDYRDLDSDNDSIGDVIEGGNGPVDTDGNGTIDPTEGGGDTDGDGIPNNVDEDPATFGDAGNPALPNEDGTGGPDFQDTDSNDDGTNDIEDAGNSPLDGNDDGVIDDPTDPDNDGIPNVGGNDSQPADFGGTDAPDTTDTDNDGIPDSVDLDDDNDGIPDTVEEATAINGGDTDGDGIPDSLDLDSDNDGILDITEAGHGAADADNDGRLDGPVGTDGIPDAVQDAGDEDAGTINYTPVDTDGDGSPDFQDLDSDNDGINDVIESNGTDDDNDGQADDPIDGDGVPGSVPAGGATPPDTDGDTVPDYQDLDSDNDGINDVIEAGLPDPDNNGIVGTGATPTDTDDDGIVDDVDGTPNAFGDSGSPAPTNTDNDPIPDYRDLDSDNDSVGDVIEGGNGPVDTDGNGTIDPTEGGGDTDGDGIPDNVDEDPTNFGDAGNPIVPNTDSTGTPDYQDTDSNDDGTNDIEDAGNSPLDTDDDGVIDDPTDPDGDGIPNVGGNDSQPADFGGTDAPRDTDNDGIPDIIDLDDDNDGIPDTVEEATAINGGDTDGDGIPDSLDLDSDNDGILDITEAGHGAADADDDGRVDGTVGADGIPDAVQDAGDEDAGTINYTPVDTDGDGSPDFQDLDSDNDGINDVIESNGTDADNDGRADDPIDANGVPGSVPAGGATPPDTDGDTVPDYQDLDSDNDGINDVVEAGLPDPDNNGIVGTGSTPTDTDDDGIVDDVDGTPNAFGDSGSPAPTNTDNDPIPDYRDLDSDNDSIGDVIEGGNGPVDTDGNGTIDPTEGGGDTDGDGIPNNVDEDPATFGDAGNPVVPNTDGTDNPDYQDPDSNNDGTNDIEDAGNSPLDGNDDGVIDDPTDPDGDGIPNVGGNDSQPADFGGTDAPDAPADTDNDGIPDSVDLDDDNDGIPDTVEEATAINGGDTDGDGIPDSLDLDSDNDGILDITEAGHGAADADNDGRLDGPVGTDGIPDAVQDTGDEDAGTINYTPVDTDGDGSPDFQDLDSDNDGINDVIESDGTDANNDGQADDPIDGNGVPSSVPVGGATPPDTDGDNVPDYQDLDSDNDGINDVVEAGLPDPDNNGIVGTGATPTDTDDDGIVDDVDGTPNAFGDSGSPAPTNTDNDPIPDYRDLDSDNDSIGDVIEGGNGPVDTDGNGTIDPTEGGGDTDGDGIPNNVDEDPATFGDAGNPALPNEDGTGGPDFQDTDSDDDGTNDIEDAGNSPLDGNDDGVIDDPTDPDGDGIPNVGGNDSQPADFGGTDAPDAPADTDNDGIPDSVDLDDDNDGIPDTVEEATAINGGDTDGDGIPDSLDLDSDNDGILDITEAGHGAADADNDGRLDGPVGTDGIPDAVQDTGDEDAGTINYTPVDTDGDGIPDFQDLDSDNDGINDVIESDGTDANNDGQADDPIDGNGVPSSVPVGGATPPDTDGDNVPDYQDLDSDNDGINDVVEAGLPDPDNNGIVGTGATPTDTDDDGIVDDVDGTPNAFGDSGSPAPTNTDNDPIPDYRDLDSDNDSIGDVIEGGNGPVDTDGNGTIDPTEGGGDTDGDGIPNNVDEDPATFGDAGNPALPNEDGTGGPDFQDTDSDDDGTNDIEDAGNSPLDGNDDGVIDDPTDPDNDGIPDVGGNDSQPADFGGTDAPDAPGDETFEEWQEKNGPSTGSTPDSDNDKDGVDDLCEWALGSDPASGVYAGLQWEFTGQDSVRAFYTRPTNLPSLDAHLIVASDLEAPISWTDTTVVPSIVQNGNGTETVSWNALENDPMVSSQLGFATLCFTLTSGPNAGAKCFTKPIGWCQTPIDQGSQTVGYPWLKAYALSGGITSNTASSVTIDPLSLPSGGVAPLLMSGSSYYLEVVSGSQEGQRFEVDEVSSAGNTIAIDASAPAVDRPSSGMNTSTLSAGALTGSQFILRAHVTVNEVLDKTLFNGSTDPNQADQVSYFGANQAFTTYTVLDARAANPSIYYWAKVGDVTSVDAVSVAPGTGMYVKRQIGTQVLLLHGGLIRCNTFQQPLVVDYTFVASGFAVDMTPNERGLSEGTSFTPSNDPAQSAQFLIWDADAPNGPESFTSHWLLPAPFSYWAPIGAPQNNQNDVRLFDLCRASFYDVKTAKPAYSVPVPYSNLNYLSE